MRRITPQGSCTLFSVLCTLSHLLSHQRHLRILSAQLPAHLAGGREAHAYATDILRREVLFRSRRSTGNAGMKRTEVAESHTLPIAQTSDHLRLKRVEHGLHVRRVHGTRSRNVSAISSSFTGVTGIALAW